MNYSEEQYAICEAFLKTKEGSVLITNEDKTLVVNLLGFIDDMIDRKIAKQIALKEIERAKNRGKPSILDASGRKL